MNTIWRGETKRTRIERRRSPFVGLVTVPIERKFPCFTSLSRAIQDDSKSTRRKASGFFLPRKCAQNGVVNFKKSICLAQRDHCRIEKNGIDGQVEPYIGVIRFFRLHFFPVDEIVSQIVLASDLLKLIAMLPDGDLFSNAERSLAVKLLWEGKSVADVFKQIRPNTSPKASAP